MSVKVKEKVYDEKEPSFPMLMISEKGQIILAKKLASTGALVGTNINGVLNSIGEYSSSWSASSFKPFYGSITIENAPNNDIEAQ